MLAVLAAGAFGIGALALQDLDDTASQGGTQASLTGSAPGIDASSRASSSELSGIGAGIASLSELATVSPTPTLTATATSIATPTETPTAIPTETIVMPTDTPEPLPTDTPEPPTATPVPPTDTPAPPTATPMPPTATPTLAIPTDIPLLGEYVPPTATPVPPTPVPPTFTPIRPTATPSPTATATRGPAGGDTNGLIAAYATRYADSLEGNAMACGGVFDQADVFIIAVGLKYDRAWPCGTQIEVCGPASCIVGVRTDTCPGCPGADIDMSRAGLQAVCGNQGGCNVVLRRLQ